MIIFLATRRNCRTLTRWLDLHEAGLGGRVRVLPYQDMGSRFPVATYVFADVERLRAGQRRLANRVWNRLSESGFHLLNHPTRSLRRYHLQKVLCNDFEVYRADDEMSDVRFPVFLRNENDHRGNLTPLIQTRAELDEAIERHPEALIVEFIDTSDENGIYRKYSYYRIGDRLFPGHLDFSTSWLVKGGLREPADPRLLSEHRAFVFESPHEKQVAEAFHRARIDYGRIDYAVSEGRLQVFEINTNPTLSGAVLPEWGELPEVTRTIVAAVLELDRPVQHIEEVRMSRLPPYCWPWKPRFVR